MSRKIHWLIIVVICLSLLPGSPVHCPRRFMERNV